MKEYIPHLNCYTMTDDIPNYDKEWELMAKDFEERGDAGYTLVKGVTALKAPVYYILYRSSAGKLLGIVCYIPPNSESYTSDVTICVDPKYQRQGIGLLLLQRAMIKWHIDLTEQCFTTSGLKLLLSYLRMQEMEKRLSEDLNKVGPDAVKTFISMLFEANGNLTKSP